MKHARKLTAMMLVLAFLFLLSTSAFAVREDGQSYTYEGLQVSRWMIGGSSTVTAYMEFDEPTENGYSFSAKMVLAYTYCPSNAMRPSNYVTHTVTKSFTEQGDGDMISLTSSSIPAGCVLIEATCSFEATITTPNATVLYEPDDLTIYLN